MRPRGWIQDSGSLDNLIKVVELFDCDSETYQNLVADELPRKIADANVRNRLLGELQNANGHDGNPLIKFHALTGTRTPNNMVDGIVQALIPGQNRVGIVDWACDNFVRFAYTLDFIQYVQAEDAFTVTDLGLSLSQAADNEAKYAILKQSLKQYGPAVRILELLFRQLNENAESPSLTKFELGRELGFKGEDGFTTFSQTVFIQALNSAQTTQDKSKIRQNWEGSSDKYARMICGWLEKVGWVRRTRKEAETRIGQEVYNENLQSYQITADGIAAFRSCRAYSRNRGTIKNIPFEMLATKGADLLFLRTKRALIINFLNRARTLGQIQRHLNANQLVNIPTAVILDDIENFTRIGLEIEERTGTYRIKDEIGLLEIPAQSQPLTPSVLMQVKQNLSQDIGHLPHTFFDLLDLSIAGNGTPFEVRIVDLLNTVVSAKHLSGGNRPEIIAYYPAMNPSDGAIIDSKSYANGFSIPAAERDKMIRYLEEYEAKNSTLNPNRWWENFQSPNYPNAPVKYAFVSSSFVGNFQTQLQYIFQRTEKIGCAVGAESLIRKIDRILNPAESYSAQDFFAELGSNGSFV